MYVHGNVSAADKHFASLSYECLASADLADFVSTLGCELLAGIEHFPWHIGKVLRVGILFHGT